MATSYEKQVLSNGLRVILAPRAESLATTILIMTETGSKYETDAEAGLSHFIEHMCFKGTRRRPRASQISEELDSLGAGFNAFTSQEYTGYYATVAPKSVRPALDLLADLYLHSQFPENEIEKERGVIIEEINMYEDLPMRAAEELLFQLMYSGQPAGRPIIGYKETVRAFGRADFLNYHARHYLAGSTIVIMAGRLPGRLTELAARQLAAVRTEAKPSKSGIQEKQNAPALVVKFKPSDQTHLAFGLRAYPAADGRRAALEVLAAILGGGMSSRLFRRIRDDMGAAYYVRANYDAYTDHGLLEIAVGADNRRGPDIVRAVTEESGRLRDKLVSAAELGRAKESLAGQLALSLETSSGLASFYALAEISRGRLESPAAAARRIRSVTAAEVRAVAREVIAADRLNLGLVGPVRDQTSFAAALKL